MDLQGLAVIPAMIGGLTTTANVAPGGVGINRLRNVRDRLGRSHG